MVRVRGRGDRRPELLGEDVGKAEFVESGAESQASEQSESEEESASGSDMDSGSESESDSGVTESEADETSSAKQAPVSESAKEEPEATTEVVDIKEDDAAREPESDASSGSESDEGEGNVSEGEEESEVKTEEEKKEDPAFVPKAGKYFMHDDRRGGGGRGRGRGQKKVWEPEESKWEHDLFHLLESDEPLRIDYPERRGKGRGRGLGRGRGRGRGRDRDAEPNMLGDDQAKPARARATVPAPRRGFLPPGFGKPGSAGPADAWGEPPMGNRYDEPANGSAVPGARGKRDGRRQPNGTTHKREDGWGGNDRSEASGSGWGQTESSASGWGAADESASGVWGAQTEAKPQKPQPDKRRQQNASARPAAGAARGEEYFWGNDADFEKPKAESSGWGETDGNAVNNWGSVEESGSNVWGAQTDADPQKEQPLPSNWQPKRYSAARQEQQGSRKPDSDTPMSPAAAPRPANQQPEMSTPPRKTLQPPQAHMAAHSPGQYQTLGQQHKQRLSHLSKPFVPQQPTTPPSHASPYPGPAPPPGMSELESMPLMSIPDIATLEASYAQLQAMLTYGSISPETYAAATQELLLAYSDAASQLAYGAQNQMVFVPANGTSPYSGRPAVGYDGMPPPMVFDPSIGQYIPITAPPRMPPLPPAHYAGPTSPGMNTPYPSGPYQPQPSQNMPTQGAGRGYNRRQRQ